MPADDRQPLIDRLLAIKPAGLSPNGWALKAGVSRTVFNDIRKRDNVRHDTLVKLLGAVNVSLAEFDAGAAADVQDTGMSDAEAVAAIGDPRSKLQRLPLVGSAIGGAFDEAEHIELTELILGDVLDHLPRPEKLAGDRKAYAVTIVGESMAPRFEPGEVALVSPQQPVAIGDDVIVQLRGHHGEDADADHANRVTMVLIKRLVKRSARELTLRQFNPDAVFTVPIGQVASTHKVVGRV